MVVNFITPPPLKSKQPPERVAGCVYGLYPVPNIFILYAAAVAKEAGCQVKFIDLALEGKNENDYRDFLSRDSSDVYAFYTVNLAIETDLYAAEIIREIKKGSAHILFFGPAPTYYPEKFCRDYATTVVRGEPEATMQSLCSSQMKNRDSISGVSYYRNGLIENPMRALIENPDSIPFPARELIKQELYYSPKLVSRPFTAALVSRNCPHECKFCVPCSLSFATELEYRRFNSNKKPRVRKRSPENVFKEFALLKEQGYKAVSFQDDQFIWDYAWTSAVVEAIGSSGVEWGCACRADAIRDDIISVMAKNGCKYIDLGIESFDQPILDDIKKNISAGIFKTAVSTIKKHGIAAKMNILIGASPLETEETVRRSMKMVKELGADQVMYNIASPFPGTEFYKEAKANNWFRFGDYVPVDVQKESIISYPNLSAEKMEELVMEGNRKFFLSFDFFRKNLWRLKSLRHAADAIKTLIKKLKKPA